VDPLGGLPILGKEPAVDQAPELEHATDGIRVSTLIDTTVCRRVPLVSCRLLRFVEGHVRLQFARCIVCVARVNMVGVTICWDTENNFVSWEASGGPGLDG
jgi:hypothetical protein